MPRSFRSSTTSRHRWSPAPPPPAACRSASSPRPTRTAARSSSARPPHPAPVPGAADPNNVLKGDFTVVSFGVIIHGFEDADRHAVGHAGLERVRGSAVLALRQEHRHRPVRRRDRQPTPGSTKDDAERFTAAFADDFSGWKLIQMPFDQMTRKDIGNGAPNDGFGLTEVHGWAFGTLATAGTQTYYLDDVRALRHRSRASADGRLLGRRHAGDRRRHRDRRAQAEQALGRAGHRRLRDHDRHGDPRPRLRSGSRAPSPSRRTDAATIAVETIDDAKYQGERGVVVELSQPGRRRHGQAAAHARARPRRRELRPDAARRLRDGRLPLGCRQEGDRRARPRSPPATPLAVPGQGAYEHVLSVGAAELGQRRDATRDFAAAQDWSNSAGLETSATTVRAPARRSPSASRTTRPSPATPTRRSWKLVWTRRVRHPRRHRAEPGVLDARDRRRHDQRQARLGQRRAAVLHRQHRQRRDRRRGQPRHHDARDRPRDGAAVLLRPVPVHLGAPADPEQVRVRSTAASRSRAGAARRRPLAGLLDAGHRHRPQPVAADRRDRHHGERRPHPQRGLRHDPRPRLLRRPVLRRHLRLRRAGRRRLPHVRGRVGSRARSPGTSTASSTTRPRPPTSTRTSGSSTTRSS